ncbi:MAG: ABC transporter permease [Planctomycetota bacterium]
MSGGNGRAWRGWLPGSAGGWLGLALLVMIALPCVVSLPWSVSRYAQERLGAAWSEAPPSLAEPMGTDRNGRSLVWGCAMGGAFSLGGGVAAASIAVGIGTAWGMTAGFMGGRVDAAMMRTVDVLYGLPYILLVVLMNVAFRPLVEQALSWATGASVAGSIANVVTLLLAIGAVSWLTMARVVRGQTLSLRAQPFVEAARCLGLPTRRILLRHVLPNLTGPIIVYATLAIPQAILQESFLSFLGIGVQPPVPSWGSLAAEGTEQFTTLLVNPAGVRWWLLAFPCLLLSLTLLGLNLLGDDLRDRLDPRASPAGGAGSAAK